MVFSLINVFKILSCIISLLLIKKELIKLKSRNNIINVKKEIIIIDINIILIEKVNISLDAKEVT